MGKKSPNSKIHWTVEDNVLTRNVKIPKQKMTSPWAKLNDFQKTAKEKESEVENAQQETAAKKEDVLESITWY